MFKKSLHWLTKNIKSMEKVHKGGDNLIKETGYAVCNSIVVNNWYSFILKKIPTLLFLVTCSLALASCGGGGPKNGGDDV